MNRLFLKVFTASEDYFKLFIYSDKGDFIARGAMKLQDDGEILAVTDTLARRNFGSYLYDFMAMFAHERGLKVTCDMEGNSRVGAIKNWQRMYNDSSFNRVILDEYYKPYIEWTTVEDDPFYFTAFSKAPSDLYLSLKTDDNIDDLFHSVIKHFEDDELDGISYQNDCNKWMDDEFPIDREKLAILLK